MSLYSPFFFFNDTATTEIYTLSLHDALPICHDGVDGRSADRFDHGLKLTLHVTRCTVHGGGRKTKRPAIDRKSTRLNSSHLVISYAVFCLKKKKNENINKTHEPRMAKGPSDN